jgi:hypothetical protein
MSAALEQIRTLNAERVDLQRESRHVMANQRSKNKQQAPISFTKEEIAQLEVFQKSMKMNRSDLVRRALADWMQQKRASGNEAKK